MKLLMCPPLYFDVNYEINPWMNVRNYVSIEESDEQWTYLVLLLQDLGIELSLIRQEKDSPDMVFTANGGFIYGNIAILPNFKYDERRKEKEYFEKWFRENNYYIYDLPDDLYFEGEGDLFLYNNFLVGGYGFRTDKAALEKIAWELEVKVLSLELINPWFYHLDTCFCPLDENTIMCYMKAFSKESQEKIKTNFKNVINVSEKEAKNFVCNSLVIGKNVVMSKNNRLAKKDLLNSSFRVYETEVSEFMKAGGGIKCLGLYLEK